MTQLETPYLHTPPVPAAPVTVTTSPLPPDAEPLRLEVPAPAPPAPVFSPRQQILATLLAALERTFNRHPLATDKLDSFRNPLVLILIVSRHCSMPEHAAEELVIASATVAELAGRVADLKGHPPENLF